jgi:carbamoyl-phosphate synthase/aspartate carbamoyltransferase
MQGQSRLQLGTTMLTPIDLKYLETLGGGSHDEQKSEYSLTQHLANNLIDMYINLPSKNHYRRPASYTSKGYHTRRMAVDFAVPLITNVKNAKMLAEALVRKLPLDVSSIDSKSSHLTHSFPGLVNIATFVPGLLEQDSDDMLSVTNASIGAGFTTVLVLPWGTNARILDRESLEQARSSAAGAAHCNFALCVTATSDNTQILDEELQAGAKSLFIPFRIDNPTLPLSIVAAHFSSWPVDKPVITDAKGSDLASMLLLASLHNRSVHVTDVQSHDDILLISLSKAKHLKVTCDVSVYSLFFTREQYPYSTLPSAADHKALWKNLDVIDVFSVGATPYRLSLEAGKVSSSSTGLRETLPLLLTAVADGRLTLSDIRKRLHDNPVLIFGLPDQAHTSVEVVLGRKAPFTTDSKSWSPLEGHIVSGAIHRVIMHAHTVFLDGSFFPSSVGQDISGASVSHTSANPLVRPTSPIAEPSSRTTAMPWTPSSSVQASGANVHGIVAPHPYSHIPHPSFHRRHILSVKQFTQRDLYDLFSLAHEMRLQVERNGILDVLKGKVLCTLFYEPSTRTSSSFEVAMKRCGGEVVQTAVDASSVLKGESLPDTIRTLGCYSDAIVLRHPDVGSSQLAAKFSPVPILNAGDGIGEHPTQASPSPHH